MSRDSFGCIRTFTVGSHEYDYFSLPDAAEAGGYDIARLPMSLKVLLENLLRFEDDNTVKRADIEVLAGAADDPPEAKEIAYRPARVLMQDFTGVPAVADLAAMRAAVESAGKDPALINPLSPVDLVIDHSVMVDRFGNDAAFDENVAIEMERNRERYRFLRWGANAFDNFRVVPPGTGICHQVNLEYLAQTVWTKTEDGRTVAYPDTLVGTDSHTTMVNGLGVLGWGVGGIEAEAAMLGQPISMLVPEVVGFELTRALRDGITATDLVLRVVEMLRAHGVVGKFVEFHGEGLDHLPLADRATIANMAPEYGATCGFFPVDAETIRYLKLSGRPAQTVALVEAYAKAQGMWRDPGVQAVYSSDLSLDLATIRPALAGPKRPQDRVDIADMSRAFDDALQLSGRHGADTRVPGQRHRSRSRPRRRRDRRHHVLYQHIEPGGHARCRFGSPEGCRPGLARQAMGENVARTRFQGGDGIPRRHGSTGLSGPHRVQLGRLWLHDLHRQLRAAPGRYLRGDTRRRSGRVLGPLREPQFRRPRAPGSAHQLAGVATLGGRLRHRGDHTNQSRVRSARTGSGRQRCLSARHLAKHGRS